MALLGAARQVAEGMLRTPEGRADLDTARWITKQKRYNWLTVAFGQPSEGWTPAQLAYLRRLYDFWFMGELAVTRLPVGCSPFSDRQRRENQAAVNALRLIDGPQVSARVDLEQYNDPHGDGTLEWGKEITLGIFVPGDEPQEAWAHVNGPGGPVPLEIGNTDTVTTYMHLIQGLGVARWPYDWDHVVLMVPSDGVREVERYGDPNDRWKPKPMWRPWMEFEPEAAAAFIAEHNLEDSPAYGVAEAGEEEQCQ